MSIEGHVWNKANSAWRELKDSATITWDFSVNHEVKAIVIPSLAGGLLGALTPEADKAPYFDTASTAALFSIPAFGRTLVANASASDARDDLLAEPRGKFYGINTQTDSYTLVLGDAGKLIEMNKATANNLTVPPQSSVAWEADTRIDIAQYGAGQTTVVAGSGVTIRSKDGNLKLTGRYSGGTLYRRASDEWVLIGDLTA